MTIVPEPVLDRIQVLVREDGRFGVEDPINWPQYFSIAYCHYPLISRRPSNPNDDRQPLWWRPTPHDFVPLHGSAVSNLGTLSPERRGILRSLVNKMTTRISIVQRNTSPRHINFCDLSMRASMSCLSFPSTYRDLVVQVANVQRYWLEAEALLKYEDVYKAKFLSTNEYNDAHSAEPNTSVMGCYTSDPVAAFKLFNAGIPVWLIRSPELFTREVAVGAVVMTKKPHDIEIRMSGFGQRVYSGHVGERHHAAVSMGGHTYMDIPRIFIANPESTTTSTSLQEGSSSSQQTRQAGHPRSASSTSSQSRQGSKVTTKSSTRDHRPAPYRSQGKRHSQATPAQLAVSRRDKFVEEHHPLFPPRIPVWTECLAQVNRQEKVLGQIGYFVPEPALLVGPSDESRQLRYITNWLRAKDPWFHLVTHSVFKQEPIHQQWWRNYLNHLYLNEPVNVSTHSGQEKAEVFALFRALSPEDNVELSRGDVQFYGQPFTSLQQVRMCQEILWEVYEMGFRLELLELDRRIRPSPSTLYARQGFEYERLDRISSIFGGGGNIRLEALPATNCGLASENPVDRVPALECFRQILVQWPGVPSPLVQGRFTRQMSHQSIEALERVAIQFYLQQFFVHSSRAAIVPHRYPM
ncbi:hypothetical protein NLI96_g3039 [Meripilus lineatus]|uniref:Uncharacterized protein n=1 Tax=Meripilus lineatus TaxID=2056292 RepID=A0AAD5YLA1_9APHY|nr:hypothetical protein NLI96_g3039 [Physisporinus lineatus]